MSNSNLILVLLSFAFYLGLMILIGWFFLKKNKNSSDYFLGGRGLNGWVAALSAQASDMSGWSLMGLPGAAYAYGVGQAWIAIGLLIGTILNWVVISKRLRRYTIRANNSMTLPEFFSNRFHDDKKILMLISSIVITLFFLVYTASALAAGGKLFNSVFGIDYHIALAVGAVVILAYTFMGGFLAVCTTDFVQGMLMVVGVLIVPIIAYSLISSNFTTLVSSTNPAGGKLFYNIFYSDGSKLTLTQILSQLAWGLGYCGMPHILVRFMAVKNEKELKKSRGIAIVWVIISLAMAIMIGIIGRGYLAPEILGETSNISTENVFIEMIKKVFMSDYSLAFIGGIFLCAILAAIMSTADSQLLVTSSAVSNDIYKGFINTKASEKKVLRIGRIVVVAVAVIAFFIAWDPNSSIMALVSDAWAGFGSAFGPLVCLALFWKRTNLKGGIAGIITGALTVIIWDYIPFGGSTLSDSTGIYSLLIGFFISLISIVIVSLLTKKPDDSIIEEFEDVKKGINIE